MSNEKQLKMEELEQVNGGLAASLGTMDGGTPSGGGSAAQTDETLDDAGTHSAGSQDVGGGGVIEHRVITQQGLAGA